MASKFRQSGNGPIILIKPMDIWFECDIKKRKTNFKKNEWIVGQMKFASAL